MELIRICIQFISILAITSSSLLDLFKISNAQENPKSFTKSVSECVTALMEKHVPCASLVVMLSSTSYSNPLIKLLSDNVCYNFITRSLQAQKWLIWSDVYIISVTNFSQFNLGFNELSKDLAWNPRAQFIIIIYELKIFECNEVFESLMKLNIYNIILITISENGKIKLNTYDPFENNACGNSFNRLIKIKKCNDVNSLKTNYNHIESKFRNCSIALAAIENAPSVVFETSKEYSYMKKKNNGIEQYMLANIAKRENIILEYYLDIKFLKDKSVSRNGSLTNMLTYLQNNSASIVIGGFTLMKNPMEVFDCIWGYNHENLYVFTPTRAHNNWKKMYCPFSTTTWILIVLSYCFVTIVTIVVYRNLVGRRGAKYLALKLWGYMSGNTDAGLVRIKKLRIFIIIWIWFTFLITNFYSTAFYSLLTTKHKNKMTMTDKCLNNLPLKPCISRNIRALYKYTYNETLPENQSPICENTDAAFDMVAYTSKFYTIEMRDSYNIRKLKYIDEKGNKKFDKFRFKNDMMLAMYTRRGFPLRDKFQRYAHYHLETGLIKRHRGHLFHKYNMFNKHVAHTFETFSLSDFRVHFSILFLGYIISFICFIIEINNKP